MGGRVAAMYFDRIRSCGKTIGTWGPDRFSAPGINPVIDIGYFGYPAPFTPGTWAAT